MAKKSKDERSTQEQEQEEFDNAWDDFASGGSGGDAGVGGGDDAGSGSQGESRHVQGGEAGDYVDDTQGKGAGDDAGDGKGSDQTTQGQGDGTGTAEGGEAGGESRSGQQGEGGEQGQEGDQGGGGEAGGDGGRPAAEEDAWKASLTEEQRRHVQRLEHENLSNRGRVSALTRRQREMEHQLQRAQAGGADPLQIDPNNFPEEWQKFKENNPDAAKAIEGVFGTELTKIAKGLQERIERVENRGQENYDTEQQAILLDLHPDAAEIVNSEAFSNWLQRQPDPVQGLMQGNAYEGATLLDFWKQSPEYKPVQPPQNEAQGGGQGEGSGAAAPSNDAGSAHGRNRERLAEAAGGSKPTHGPRATTSVPEDFGDAFDYYARQQEREAS